MNKILTLLLTVLISVSCQDKTPKQVVEKNVPSVVGSIVKIKGVVLKNNVGAKEGDSLFEGDTLETKDKSFARLEMRDNTLMNLGANSKINLKDYKVSNMDERIVDINLVIGKLKTHFRNKLKNDSKGSLKVSSGMVSFGVRGTEFITESLVSGKTKMLLLEGKVVLKQKKKDVKEEQEIEIKPLEIVSISETEEITTQTVTEDVLVQVENDENMDIEIKQIEDAEQLKQEAVKEVDQKSTSTNSDVRNFLFSLEHGSKALPLKENGKIVHFTDQDQKQLARDSKGNVIAVDLSMDKGIKQYRVPVVYENGKKTYVEVSEEYIAQLIKKSKSLGVQVRDLNLEHSYSRDRMPASISP